MPNQQWKRAEAKVAEYFQTKRRPLSGLNHGTGRGDDCQHEVLYIETKHGKTTMLSQAAELYRHTKTKQVKEAPDMTPVIALCPKSMSGFLLVVHSSDLEVLCLEYLTQLGYKVCDP